MLPASHQSTCLHGLHSVLRGLLPALHTCTAASQALPPSTYCLPDVPHVLSYCCTAPQDFLKAALANKILAATSEADESDGLGGGKVPEYKVRGLLPFSHSSLFLHQTCPTPQMIITLTTPDARKVPVRVSVAAQDCLAVSPRRSCTSHSSTFCPSISHCTCLTAGCTYTARVARVCTACLHHMTGWVRQGLGAHRPAPQAAVHAVHRGWRL